VRVWDFSRSRRLFLDPISFFIHRLPPPFLVPVFVSRFCQLISFLRLVSSAGPVFIFDSRFCGGFSAAARTGICHRFFSFLPPDSLLPIFRLSTVLLRAGGSWRRCFSRSKCSVRAPFSALRVRVARLIFCSSVSIPSRFSSRSSSLASCFPQGAGSAFRVVSSGLGFKSLMFRFFFSCSEIVAASSQVLLQSLVFYRRCLLCPDSGAARAGPCFGLGLFKVAGLIWCSHFTSARCSCVCRFCIRAIRLKARGFLILSMFLRWFLCYVRKISNKICERQQFTLLV
jgi:hypothetical protein